MGARFIVADVFEGLATIPAGSVDLICTSPPFLALRSYLPADHPDKAREIGSEATPGAFIDRMLDVVEACARVLAPHGSLVFELGDTYAGSGGAGGDYNEGGLRDGAPGFDGSAARYRGNERTSRGTRPGLQHYADDRGNPDGMRDSTFQGGNTRNGGGRGWPLDKSKVLIPQLFAIALAYGFNPLTGRQTEPWRVRNTVAWCRPNPPVGRDGDKFRPATSFLTVACKARDRYWDGDAVRTPYKPVGRQQAEKAMGKPIGGGVDTYPDDVRSGWTNNGGTVREDRGGAPLLDWWEIPTQPYKGAHYATYPDQLVVPVVKSMCPQRVCRACGLPSRRIVAPTDEYEAAKLPADDPWRSGKAPQSVEQSSIKNGSTTAQYATLGWSDCGHNDWRPGVVLDPFGGSGTTAVVACGHGMDCTLIDLDERNAELAYDRIGGLYLTIEHLAAETVA